MRQRIMEGRGLVRREEWELHMGVWGDLGSNEAPSQPCA